MAAYINLTDLSSLMAMVANAVAAEGRYVGGWTVVDQGWVDEIVSEDFEGVPNLEDLWGDRISVLFYVGDAQFWAIDADIYDLFERDKKFPEFNETHKDSTGGGVWVLISQEGQRVGVAGEVGFGEKFREALLSA